MDGDGRTIGTVRGACEWCGKDAHQRLVLAPGRVTKKRTVLPRYAFVCDEHARSFQDQGASLQ